MCPGREIYPIDALFARMQARDGPSPAFGVSHVLAAIAGLLAAADLCDGRDDGIVGRLQGLGRIDTLIGH